MQRSPLTSSFYHVPPHRIPYFMNRFAIHTTFAALLVTASLSHAQVSYTGGVYSQDFNTLPGTTNNTTGVA